MGIVIRSALCILILMYVQCVSLPDGKEEALHNTRVIYIDELFDNALLFDIDGENTYVYTPGGRFEKSEYSHVETRGGFLYCVTYKPQRERIIFDAHGNTFSLPVDGEEVYFIEYSFDNIIIFNRIIFEKEESATLPGKYNIVSLLINSQDK